MIVSRSQVEEIVRGLTPHRYLSLDTETTGLRPYSGDRLFSLIIAAGEPVEGGIDSPPLLEAYYFNFQPYNGLDPDLVLSTAHLELLQPLFRDPHKVWFLHNAKYDMAILAQEGISLQGEIHCTQAQGRIECNDHMQYSLDASLARIGLAKDPAVDNYIKEHKLWTDVPIPGRKDPDRREHYDRVPFEIIQPYGESDGRGTWSLGMGQLTSIANQSAKYPPGARDLCSLAAMEKKLTKTVFKMEALGVKIDRKYCERAAAYELDQMEKHRLSFKTETGRELTASPKLLAEVFESDRENWELTEKGNPSFKTDIIKYFKNPAAKSVLELRDAESRYRFYTGFLYHSDRDDVVHPNFNPGGADTGRFSSSEPNFQNLTSEEGDEEKEFLVRRAIVPRPGFVFIMPDYDQVEYKLMLDYAKMMMIAHFKKKGQAWDESYFEVANKVAGGFDVHQATADMVGFSRSFAKAINFGLLFGMGVPKLSKSLGVAVEEGRVLKRRYFAALPYVEFMVAEVQAAVKARGWIRNWAGRKFTFSNRDRAYVGPNKLIQGGAADVLKFAMNDIDEELAARGAKSRLVLTIHDELPSEIHESELAWAPQLLKTCMERAYPYHHIPLTAGMEWSDKSLADKKKGMPV